MASLVNACLVHDGGMMATKMTIATLDLFRSGGIKASLQLRLLIIFAALLNFGAAFCLVYVHFNIMSAGEWFILQPVLVFMEILDMATVCVHPLLYFGRYDAILYEYPKVILALKISWLLPIAFRMADTVPYIQGVLISNSTSDFLNIVVYSLLGMTDNGIAIATEMAIIVFSDLFILWKMKAMAEKLNRPFFEIIGNSRIIRMTIMIGTAIAASIWASYSYSTGNEDFETMTGPMGDFTQAIQFTVLLDFYELDMGVFRNPNAKSSANVIGTGASRSNVAINGLTSVQTAQSKNTAI